MSEAAAVIEPVVEVTALETAPPAAEPPAVVVEGAADAANDNWLPEKHVVKKEDGSIDLEASARKQAEAYKHLEKRLGAGDIPPKSAEEYAPELSIEGYDLEELKNDELYKDFAAKAHAEGFTNKQLSLAVNEFLPRVAEIMQANAVQSAEDCNAELAKVWATPNEMTVNKQNALRVINAYAESPEQAKAIVKAVGNNAEALKLLAKIGPELQEGKSPNNATVGIVDIEALMKSDAYLDANHPEHTSTKERVSRYYKEKFPDRK